MARLITSGWEAQSLGLGAEDVGFLVVGGAVETTVVRSGKASFKVDTSGHYGHWAAIGQALDRNYYWRFYLRFPTAPSSNAVVARLYSDVGTTTICSVRLSTGRLVALLNAAGSNVQGASSPALAVDTWHRIEVRVNVPASGNGTLDLRVNGTTVGSVATTGVGNVAPHTWRHGYISGTVPSLYFDDVALNDDQGSDQNLWPGEGKIVLLRPTSDGTINSWRDGNGGSSNLYNGLDNSSPSGVAISAGATDKQIENPTNDALTYTAILGAYTTALASGGGGLASTDIVTLIQALATGGDSHATLDVTMGVKPSSNPAGTEGTGVTPPAAAGTYSTGWTTRRSAISYAPSVTLGTSPQIEFRKAVASADTLAFCFAGLYVEYVPRTLVTATAAEATAASSAPVPGISVTGVGEATASAPSPVPGITVYPGALEASGSAPPPTPSITIEAPAAEATASAPTPTVAEAVTVTAVTGEASASAPAPVLGITVEAGASATASADAPTLSITGDKTIVVPAAEATASFPAPTVSGQAPQVEGGWVRPRRPVLKPPRKDVLILAPAAEATAEFPPPTITHFMSPAMQREEEFVLALI